MVLRVAVLLLVSVSVVFAAGKRRPSTSAATQPTTESSTTAPATKPATTQLTPRELMEQMKQSQDERKKLLKVAHIDVSGQIIEKPLDFTLFGGSEASTLRTLISRLKQARDDAEVRAVLITLNFPSLSMAQAEEIRSTLAELRRAGKSTFVYADTYDTVSYTLASGATNICMLEGGEIMIPGVGMEAMFAKGMLDMVGVQADYVQIGEYKGADEQFTRAAPSNELRGELTKLIDSYYAQIVEGISLNRNLPTEKVKQLIDDAMVGGKAAKDRGLVDHLVDQDGLRDLLQEELGDEIDLIADYGQDEQPAMDLSNPWAMLAMMARKPAISDKPHVAIIYVDGAIVDGQGGSDMWGTSYVGSETMREALRSAARDEQVHAVVLRIDSPGGSALASEAIWQSVRRVAGEKPVVISIGSMAASGGYYIAVAGDYIFADPSAIVGSIGVVGGKFVTKDLYAKLGLATEAFTRGRNADLFSANQPFNDRQRRMVTNWMKATYEQFLERVKTTRGRKIKDIDEVARGRIFLADDAKQLGMIDELGGLEEAIAYAARRAQLDPGDYDVKTLPAAKTIADYLRGGSDVASPVRLVVQISPDSALHALPATARRALMQQLTMFKLLENRPVILATPWSISFR